MRWCGKCNKVEGSCWCEHPVWSEEDDWYSFPSDRKKERLVKGLTPNKTRRRRKRFTKEYKALNTPNNNEQVIKNEHA
jgi:Tol biopolymer transport system component